MLLPRVTAIIIVLNGEMFIEEAIASVRAQSLADWELLIVDDGSTDRTIELAKRAARADPGRVRLLRHPDHGNHGMSATRNLGLGQARGEYVGFLDADDVWLPEKLAEQVAILDAEPAVAMTYGRALIWHSWDTATSEPDSFYSLGVQPDRTYAPPQLFRQLLRNVHQTPTTSGALLRRAAVEAVGGFDPSFRTMFEDQVVFAKILLDYPVHVAGRCWFRYRQHPAAETARRTSDEEAHRAHLRYLRALRVHLARRPSRVFKLQAAVDRTIAELHVRHRAREARRWFKQRLRRR